MVCGTTASTCRGCTPASVRTRSIKCFLGKHISLGLTYRKRVLCWQRARGIREDAGRGTARSQRRCDTADRARAWPSIRCASESSVSRGSLVRRNGLQRADSQVGNNESDGRRSPSVCGLCVGASARFAFVNYRLRRTGSERTGDDLGWTATAGFAAWSPSGGIFIYRTPSRKESNLQPTD
jgi:hypothetical protein